MKRLTENGEAADVKECMAKSVKTVFGLDLSDEELEASLAKPEQPEASSGESGKMDLDELDHVAGGNTDETEKTIVEAAAVTCEGFIGTGELMNAVITGGSTPLGVLGGIYYFGKRFFGESDKRMEEYWEDPEEEL